MAGCKVLNLVARDGIKPHASAAVPVFRAVVQTGAVEQLTPSHPVTAADVVAFAFSGVTPSGRLFGTLIRNNSDLYAMDVDFGW